MEKRTFTMDSRDRGIASVIVTKEPSETPHRKKGNFTIDLCDNINSSNFLD
jgi:hypothetical protein